MEWEEKTKEGKRNKGKRRKKKTGCVYVCIYIEREMGNGSRCTPDAYHLLQSNGMKKIKKK